MSARLGLEDARALSMIRAAGLTPTAEMVCVLGTDLYSLAVELAGDPDGHDEEWLTAELLMHAERELLNRVGGWQSMPGYIAALVASFGTFEVRS